MAESTKKDERSLELEDDIDHHRREWRSQRIAWAVMASLLLLAASGLTGRGLFSMRTATSSDGGVELEYDRFARHQAPSELTLRIAPAADSIVRVRLARTLVDEIEIEDIRPEPEWVEAHADHHLYAFRRAPGDSIVVRIEYEPASFGPVPLAVLVDGAGSIAATQFYYP